MKKLVLIFICLVFLIVPGGLFVKNANALERTIEVDGVNYVSLTQMAKKYNFAIQEDDGEVSLTGEAVNLRVGTSTNIFSLNGEAFIAQKLPEKAEGQVWISTKDWASLFDLALTHYDRVSQMEPAGGKAVSTEAVLDTTTYHVSDGWGERVPEGVRKHGNIVNIETPHIEVSSFNIRHYNEAKQVMMQGQ